MTVDEAAEISAALRAGHIGHEVRVTYIGSQAYHSVRADLSPRDIERDPRSYARDVFDLMTGGGDWSITGEDGRAYVTRY